MSFTTLPSVPVKHWNFLQHIQSKPNTPIVDLVKPYVEYDAVLRKVFAQEPSHPAIQDNYLNLVPLYDHSGSTDISVRARDLVTEPLEVKEKYILPLKPEDRKQNGSPAVVPSVSEFQANFSIFTEGSLCDLDWSNVVVAGSAVVTCLMPVPDTLRDSKRSLRQFYHDKVAPASDVDLFLYNLTEEQAIEKIKHIEAAVKGSILHETTTIRTKNTITIVSQYPIRHVQIVLRIYKSVSEILTGFDVDCSCAAYDGNQIYVAPRALTSYITQANQIDLTRRSPSYENRLSKYSHRGFEIFWPNLERSRIDPTIFERSFKRTVGLARLLVLEQLPTASDRELYIRQRREERGRPALREVCRRGLLHGNIKDEWDDEVPDWLEEEEISDYSTFSIPYGPRYHARRIQKLLYKKDLLLNAEWNRQKDREVCLHRHPAFFGNVEDVIHDCCGYCPKPETEDEKKVAEEESKIYISGDISFIKDDPGRQEIGSFNPITESDWTEMAYTGNTERLCRAIVDHNLEEVKDWLSQEGSDPNARDYAGRTPLQLSCMTSTPEIVQCLVDHGARMIARMADGQTALHLAAARGDARIIHILLTKSEQNEAEEAVKKEQKVPAALAASEQDVQSETNERDDQTDAVVAGDDDTTSLATSFIKVGKDGRELTSNLSDDDELEPDVYDINVVSWDNHTSPLHLAILNGHVHIVEILVGSFGADVLLPVKLLEESSNSSRAAILTLVLALQLPLEEAKTMTKKLLQLGASPAQADIMGHTALHCLAASGHSDLLDIYTQQDQPGVKRVIDHLAFTDRWCRRGYSALTTAINARDIIAALKILDAGAAPTLEFENFIKSAQAKFDRLKHRSFEQNYRDYGTNTTQPVIAAVEKDMPTLALDILARGADPNTLTIDGFMARENKFTRNYTTGKSLLDCIQTKLISLRNYKGERLNLQAPNPLDPEDDTYLSGFEHGTYQMWTGKHILEKARSRFTEAQRQYEEQIQTVKNKKGSTEKMAAVKNLIKDYEELERALLEKDAKTFKQLFPDIRAPCQNSVQAHHETKQQALFKVTFSFTVPDLTGVRMEGYMKLFEAAWSGDFDTIKTLTLSKWGPQNDQLPLQAAVKDSESFSPFSIAVLRGHLHVAKMILEIVETQYQPKEDEAVERFRLDETDDTIYSEIVDERFTIENIGEVAAHVECNIRPLEVLSWGCPAFRFTPKELQQTKRDKGEMRWPYPNNLIQYAIFHDDIKLLEFLLELGQSLTARDESSEAKIYSISEDSFEMALRLGRVRCITEMIQKTGQGLPIDDLARKSGVQAHHKPRYYQGLTVRGEKRPEWATVGHIQSQNIQPNSPPLYKAAFTGNLESTEWFLGTAPSRYYKKFMDSYKHDKRLQLLEQSKLGLEGSVMKWLGSRNNIVLHSAILSRPTNESQQLIQYLIRNHPSCLEEKTLEGHTPLQTAFSLRRKSFARILIGAGANQAIRDPKGRNLAHIALGGIGHGHSASPEDIRDLLGLIDPRLLPSMFTERCSDAPGSLTPIAYWIAKEFKTPYLAPYSYRNIRHYVESDDKVAVAQVVLSFAESSEQKHLELLNGAGSTPVHDAVKYKLPRIFKMMIDRRPDLIHREDSTGCTPAEIAANLWVNKIVSNPPMLPNSREMYLLQEEEKNILDRTPESFAGERVHITAAQVIYNLCRERSVNGAKRKLVTLYEANEVANRLATQQRVRVSHSLGSNENRGDEAKTDEVIMWHSRARHLEF